MAVSFGIAMPFDTFFIDFTAWSGFELTLIRLAMLGSGVVAVLKGVNS